MLYFPFIAIAAITYVAFVFFSESFNPFRANKWHSRRRWRLGRSLAMTFFIVSTATLLIKPYIDLPPVHLLSAAAILFILFCLFPSLKYIKAKDQTRNVLPQGLKSPTSTMPALVKSTEFQHEPNPTFNENYASTEALTALEPMKVASDNLGISTSEEHNLELELSALSDEEEYDNLNQTIAETEFSVADITISETHNIAQPDALHSLDSDYKDASDALLDPADQGSLQSHAPHEISPYDALMEKLKGQREEINDLTKSNQSLIKIRDTLTVDLAELKYSLKKSNAIARKSIAQRDQAVKIKNDALTLATMERKKRRLTEIKARKALTKMQNSLRELTHQTVE